MFLYWGWRNEAILRQVFLSLDPVMLVVLFFLLTLGVIFSTVAFTLLIRGMGYQFGYFDSYHSLNLSQIAAMVPGKIWGFAGLAGSLWSRGISKGDTILVIFLHTLFMLSSAILIGIISLIPIIGWGYTMLCLIPILFLLVGRSWLDAVRLHFFAGSSPLPSSSRMIFIFSVGVISWIMVSACFALLVYKTEGRWPVSPLLIASAFPAGYVCGFISLITPSGLGVREGIITIILGQFLGNQKALTLAIVFRVVHTAVIWLNIAITLFVLSFRDRLSEGEAN